MWSVRVNGPSDDFHIVAVRDYRDAESEGKRQKSDKDAYIYIYTPRHFCVYEYKFYLKWAEGG